MSATASLHREIRIVRSSEDELVCIVRDVTEQRGLEDRLPQTQKLGATSQLAAGVAHEINTPMQSVGDNLHFARSAISDLLTLIAMLKSTVEEAIQVGKGTGQGLAMAYSCVVKRHKGSIDFETELGTGSSFVIRLPLEAETHKSGAPF